MADDKCPICGLDTRGVHDAITGWWTGHSETDCLRCRLGNAYAIIDRLNDDDLADRIGRRCGDYQHDDRWCPTCVARLDAIEAYQRAVKEGNL